jgi:hypothetical protein
MARTGVAACKVSCALWIALLHHTLHAQASAPAASPTPVESTASAPEVPAEAPAVAPMLEATREGARASAEWLARGVDGWFGDLPFENGGKVSNGRVRLGVFKRRDQSADVELRFDARFRLPNVERRAYLFVGRDAQRDVVQDTPTLVTGQQRLLSDRPADLSLLAGLGFSWAQAIDFRVGVGARLRPYAQARYEQRWDLSSNQVLDFRETVFWTRDDRLGSSTALSYEFAANPNLSLRWLNAATITEVSRNFEWSSTLGAYQSLGPQRVLALEGLVSGNETRGTGVGMSDLGLLLRWQQPIYKQWLLGEVVAGHFWPRPDANSPRQRAWALGINTQMRF